MASQQVDSALQDSATLDIQPSIEAHDATADDPIDPVREQRRQAGLQDLERAMHAADKGLDPFTAPQHKAKGKGRRGRKKELEEDPDVKAFGQLFEASKVYVFMALLLASAAVSPVLIKGSLYSMQTPAVLLFLHMLATVVLLWVASLYDVFELNQLNLQGLKGCAVSGTLWAGQMLCIFSALHHNSVIFMLTWTLIGKALLQSVIQSLGSQQSLEGDVSMLLMIGAGAAGLELLLDSDKVWVGGVVLGVWTVLAALEAAWKHLKVDPSLGGRITSYKILGLVRGLSDDEDALTPANRAFLHHAVPAVVVLLLGFLALEGRELVNHELSVPAVTVMLLACASYMTTVACELLLEGKIDPQMMITLKGLATLATIGLYFLEEIRTISWAAVVCCAVACTAAYGTSLVRKPL